MRDDPGKNRYRFTKICVDSYEGEIPVGRLSNPFYDESLPFESLMQFLKIMECTLDLTGQPRSFTASRCFEAPPERLFGKTCFSGERGKLATFSLCIHFRRNSSWQGRLQWLEGGRQQSFRSTLELVFLMDSALQSLARRGEDAEENSA